MEKYAKSKIVVKTVLAFTLLSFIVLGVGSCSNSNADTVIVASKPFTESYILAEMLVQLIEADTDIQAEHAAGIAGGTANIHPAMLRGEIDIYPEYTGTGWLSVLDREAIADPMEMYKAVSQAYVDEFGIVWLDLYGFNNGYGLAMRRQQAQELGITTLSDLAAKSGQLRFGANADFFERADGFPALEDRYGFDFDELVEFTAIGFSYTALAEGQVDAINIFTTDGRLQEYNLTVLEDDQQLFPTYYAATLVRKETLQQHPELQSVLNQLGGRLDGPTMTQLNYQVEIEKKSPAQVAEDFLRSQGLLE